MVQCGNLESLCVMIVKSCPTAQKPMAAKEGDFSQSREVMVTDKLFEQI